MYIAVCSAGYEPIATPEAAAARAEGDMERDLDETVDR